MCDSLNMDSEIVLSDEKLISNELPLQKLEEKAKKAEEALEAEVKVRKDLEGLNAKLLAEKTALLDSLAGEKGSLEEFQEKSAKLTAQKNDLDNQLRVSLQFILIFFLLIIVLSTFTHYYWFQQHALPNIVEKKTFINFWTYQTTD